MRQQRPMMVDIEDADPTDAINAFLHVLNRQRGLGLCPRTEHTLAEHLFRGDAKIVFYSSASGIISLVQSDGSDDDDAFDTVMFIMERRKERRRKRREAEAAAMQAPEEAATPHPGPQEPEHG